MASYPPAFVRLIENLARLPGVGGKTAQRLAFHLLKAGPAQVLALSDSLRELHDQTRTCATCFNLCEETICSICNDDQRDLTSVCVVEEPKDVGAIEKTGEFTGRYHVLLGSLSPLDGVGPESLKIRELIERLEKGGVKEVILASNPDVEGEATAMYLAKLIKPLGIVVTRLASGLPMGSELEYTDQITLARAFVGRREL